MTTTDPFDGRSRGFVPIGEASPEERAARDEQYARDARHRTPGTEFPDLACGECGYAGYWHRLPEPDDDLLNCAVCGCHARDPINALVTADAMDDFMGEISAHLGGAR
ncbi:hypothetical protein [Streptacidiphilus sp. PAMC 29251]